MSVKEEYIRQLELKAYKHDPAQSRVVDQLQQLQQDIWQYQSESRRLSNRIKTLLGKPPSPPRGCYIWGDVGRGKTWLMDMFYDTLEPHLKTDQVMSTITSALPRQTKIRLHFHHFMQAIHDQLSLVGEVKNPLAKIAGTFAKRYQLLCLDEFHVSDITDAMLLYGLLDELFRRNVILIATSNQPPDELYKNGLQRDRFLPAIELIKQHCNTLHLNGVEDHRLRLLEKADCWYISGDDTHTTLEQRFVDLANTPAQRNQKLKINYREIPLIMNTFDMIWADFQSLCGDQRGSADYIEIARQYHTVFISQIPHMDDSHNDKARRFINMIDEYYDRNVKLLASATAPASELYSGKQLAFEFRRTVSRLEEMVSHEYLQRPHKPS